MADNGGHTRSPVTIFGHADPTVAEVGEAIRDRGAATHVVSVATGWLPTAGHAVLFLDTPAGWAAARGLEDDPGARVQVVGVHAGPAGPAVANWARNAGHRHDVTLLQWDGGDGGVVGHIARTIVM